MVYDKLACHHPAKPASADIKSKIRLRHWRHLAFCILFLACVFSMNLSLNAALLSLFILFSTSEETKRLDVCVCVCAPVISCLLCSPLATLRLMPKELISARQHLRHHCVFKSQSSTQFCSRDLVVWLHHWKNTGYKLQSNFPRFGPLNTCICQLKAKISYINRNSFPESWKYCNGWIIDWS